MEFPRCHLLEEVSNIIYVMEHYSALKKYEILWFVTTCHFHGVLEGGPCGTVEHGASFWSLASDDGC